MKALKNMFHHGDSKENEKNAPITVTSPKQDIREIVEPVTSTPVTNPATTQAQQVLAQAQDQGMTAYVEKLQGDEMPEHVKKHVFPDGEKSFPVYRLKEQPGKTTPEASKISQQATNTIEEVVPAAGKPLKKQVVEDVSETLSFEALTSKQLAALHEKEMQQVKSQYMSEKEKLLQNQQALLSQNQQLQNKMKLVDQQVEDHKKTHDILQQHVDHHKENSKHIANLNQRHMENMEQAMYQQHSIASSGYPTMGRNPHFGNTDVDLSKLLAVAALSPRNAKADKSQEVSKNKQKETPLKAAGKSTNQERSGFPLTSSQSANQHLSSKKEQERKLEREQSELAVEHKLLQKVVYDQQTALQRQAHQLQRAQQEIQRAQQAATVAQQQSAMYNNNMNMSGTFVHQQIPLVPGQAISPLMSTMATAPVQDASTNQKSMPKIKCSHILIKHRDSRYPVSHRAKVWTKDKSKEQAKEQLKGVRDHLDLARHSFDTAKRAAAFAKKAREISDCGSALEDDGNIGWFDREKMLPSFSDAAFALNIGEMSDVVESQSGLHLILRTG